MESESNSLRYISELFTFQTFAEVLILTVHPYYGCDSNHTYTINVIDMMNTKTTTIPVTYRLTDFLLAFMFLRVYFLVRTLLNFTVYSDLNSKKVCAKYGFEGTTSFFVKALYVK